MIDCFACEILRELPMRRPVNALQRIGYYLQALPFGLLLRGLRLVPLRWASPAMGWLFRTVGPRLPWSRRIRTNLDLAMPQAIPAVRQRIVRGVWDNLGRVAGEMAHLDKIWDDAIFDRAAEIGILDLVDAAATGETVTLTGDRIEIVGAEHFAAWLAGEGPALIYTPHMGNWELLPLLSARFGVLTSVVFRRPNNPYVARRVERMRDGMVSLIPKGYEGAIAAGRVMQAGGRLGFLVDQKQNRGIEVPFFDKPAMTGPTLAKLALDFGAPIFGACVVRQGGLRFRVHLQAPLRPTATGDAKADQLAVMTAVNAQIESWVRAWPEQWLWLHRRWPKHLYS